MKSLRYSLLPVLLLGCGGGNGGGGGTPDMAVATLGPAPSLAIACGDKAADLYTLPGGLPAMDDSHRGDVFHCAVTESLTAAQLNAEAQAYGYAGPALSSGAWSYRVAYRTERVAPSSGSAPEGDTPAVLLVPEKPLAGAPLVVFAHGSVGIASGCAPSRVDLTTTLSDPSTHDFPVNLYTLAGYGYTVIMPDYAGFAYGQAPGYFVAEDEAHALLDATRAAAKLLPSPPDKVVIVGHSQGGHAALSAHSYSASYGLQGTLVGVAALAPLWLSLSGFSAATSPQGGFHTASDSSTILYSMEYLYSAGELHGGAGHGLDVFQPAKAQAAKQVILGGACYETAGLVALGAVPTDFFDSAFVNQVGTSCAALPPSLGGDCTQGDAPKWLARWKLDRPSINPKGAPLLVFAGGMDTSVKPGFVQCGRDKINADLMAAGATTMVQYCLDPNATHHSIVRLQSDYVNQWIAARAGVGSEPAACANVPTTTCTVPPNNF